MPTRSLGVLWMVLSNKESQIMPIDVIQCTMGVVFVAVWAVAAEVLTHNRK